MEASVPIKAAQERLGHSRLDILLKFYAHVLDASADVAASSLSQGLGARSAWRARIGLLRKGLAVNWQSNGSQTKNLLNVSY